MKTIAIGFLILSSVMLALATPQTNTGRLVGTVLRRWGAVVPGASISVLDNRTNKERTAVSDEAGSFIVPLLDIGQYTVTVKSPGFKTFTSKDVNIQIGLDSAIPVRLEVGGVEVEVQVSASSPLVNTTSSETQHHDQHEPDSEPADKWQESFAAHYDDSRIVFE
jgi:hypothetical protein